MLNSADKSSVARSARPPIDLSVLFLHSHHSLFPPLPQQLKQDGRSCENGWMDTCHSFGINLGLKSVAITKYLVAMGKSPVVPQFPHYTGMLLGLRQIVQNRRHRARYRNCSGVQEGSRV